MRRAGAIVQDSKPLQCATAPDGEWLPYEPDDNFTKTPNAFFRLCQRLEGPGRKLSGALQLGIIAFIMQATYGGKRDRKGNRPAGCKLVNRTLAKELGCNARSIEIEIADALKRGLIERKKDEDDGRTFLYRVCPWNWDEAPDYVPRKVEQAAEEAEEAAETETVTSQPAADPLVVLPGKRSRPMPLPTRPAQVEWDNRSGLPIRFEPLIRKGEILTVRIHRQEANSATGVAVSANGRNGDHANGVALSHNGSNGNHATAVAVSGNGFVDSKATYELSPTAFAMFEALPAKEQRELLSVAQSQITGSVNLTKIPPQVLKEYAVRELLRRRA